MRVEFVAFVVGGADGGGGAVGAAAQMQLCSDAPCASMSAWSGVALVVVEHRRGVDCTDGAHGGGGDDGVLGRRRGRQGGAGGAFGEGDGGCGEGGRAAKTARASRTARDRRRSISSPNRLAHVVPVGAVAVGEADGG